MASKTLEGKVALVTGGSEGIGFSIAKSLAERGASLILVARDLEKLKHAHERIVTAYGGNHLYLSADIGDPVQVRAVLTHAFLQYSTIDILVNNAGIAPLDYLKNLPIDTLTATFHTNLLGPAYFYKELESVFERQRHGIVIDVLSKAALMILDQNTVYGASKCGHQAFSLRVQKELPSVTIYRLYPGVVNTATWDKHTSELKRTIKESADALHPDQIGRFVGELLDNPLKAETRDILLEPRADGSMHVAYLKKDSQGYPRLD